MNFQRYDPSGSRGTEIQCFQYFSVLFCNLMIVLVFQSVLGEMTVFQCFTCLISFPMFQCFSIVLGGKSHFQTVKRNK